jgi:hypothetical protein
MSSQQRPANDAYVSAVRDCLAQLMSTGEIEHKSGTPAFNLILTAHRKFYFLVTFDNVRRTPFGIRISEKWFVIEDGVLRVSENNKSVLLEAALESMRAQS